MYKGVFPGGLVKTKEAEVEIRTVAFGGEGVGRVGDKVIFVPFTAPGDTVRVGILEDRKRYFRGRPLEILHPGPGRTDSPCPYFTRCGGCDYQHLSYGEQLSLKARQVREVFQRIGRIPDPPVLATVPSPAAFHYRGKGEYHVRYGKDGRPFVGFMDVTGGEVLNIPRCFLVEDSINEAVQVFREEIRLFPGRHREGRYPFWSAGEGGEGEREGEALPFPVVRRRVKDLVFQVPRDGFFQANLFLVDGLVERVLEGGSRGAVDSFLDGYCGCGLFSLFLASRAAEVTGADTDGKAVRAARVNARAAGLRNLCFHRGTTEEVVRRRLRGGGSFEAVLLDPPRGGCEPSLLHILSGEGFREIVYVSCNPATQARDVRFLLDRGYGLSSLEPLDMFPQTKHVEVIARLTRS